ncbi:penicillin-binding transpeptidase domain-containing protein [Clostridium omnivorum]|uniref:Penicillin-binding protein n=1 Tax=Clostridium omnivorum TaxID=1604902 RepID=A0ABQ5NCR9_9CLOT|nr:penicillin-binding transpeptidase domain-containing protein [Clostridium sp. E14]GLC32871.1 penicillin-binding protein [Clostridium sp. E14]
MINKSENHRLYFILCVFSLVLAFLLWRAKVMTIDQSPVLKTMADLQYSQEIKISDLNYTLFDKNGKNLLNYKTNYYAVIDGSLFIRNYSNTNENDDIYALIYILRNYNKDYDLSNIGLYNDKSLKYYKIDESTYNKLKLLKNIKGFYTYTNSEVDRTEAWSIENLLTRSTNPIDNKQKSASSLEMLLYNKTKGNQYPTIKIEKDIEGNVISQQNITSYPDNTNVRLTIDKNIQDKIKSILNSDKYKDLNQVGVILMEASTGKIRAITQKDDTQPNVNLGSATESGFYMGSVFKVLVEESGIERKLISTTDKYPCVQKIYKNCKDKDHGILNAEEALVVSCNNVYAQLGDIIGVNNILDNAQAHGLSTKILNFDSEAKGQIDRPDTANGEGSGQFVMGQTARVTPIQVINVPNTVVNNGIYIKPQIIEAYVDENNNEKEKVSTTSQSVISKNTAAILKEQMKKVVKQGTGTAANIDGIEVGGKTGSTERYDGTKKLSDGWFAGFFKYNNQYYSMVVFAKEIDPEKQSGGTTAAPIFKDIVMGIKEYLK